MLVKHKISQLLSQLVTLQIVNGRGVDPLFFLYYSQFVVL